MRNKNISDDDPLDHEIDFTKSRPNPYWLGVVDRQCVRLLDRDLADLFPDNESVNAALRAIADAARRTRRPVSARRTSGPRKTTEPHSPAFMTTRAASVAVRASDATVGKSH
jgi:hypothetical protein